MEGEDAPEKDGLVVIALQVNGKLRGTIEAPASASRADLRRSALADPAVQKAYRRQDRAQG